MGKVSVPIVSNAKRYFVLFSFCKIDPFFHSMLSTCSHYSKRTFLSYMLQNRKERSKLRILDPIIPKIISKLIYYLKL